jgi:D-hydroxyproline dehydrogenase subunit alpha
LTTERSEDTVLVVGAGLSGLAAAAELATRARVRIVERLPAAGGIWGFEHKHVGALFSDCRKLGVELILGATALRWSDRRLLVLGPGVADWLPGEHLIFAGGSRPSHAAELRVTGSRLAGVFVATAAHHLLEAGIRLGRHTVVTGWGDWVETIVPHLLESGEVTLIGGEPQDQLAWPQVRWWPGYRPQRLIGDRRVERVEVSNGGGLRTVHCDSVIFAGGLKAIRNVDGANQESAERTTFIQPTAIGLDADAVISQARAATAMVQLPWKGTA